MSKSPANSFLYHLSTTPARNYYYYTLVVIFVAPFFGFGLRSRAHHPSTRQVIEPKSTFFSLTLIYVHYYYLLSIWCPRHLIVWHVNFKTTHYYISCSVRPTKHFWDVLARPNKFWLKYWKKNSNNFHGSINYSISWYQTKVDIRM